MQTQAPAPRPPAGAVLTPGLALAIAALASAVLLLRLLGVDWDSGAALNPDARHLYNIASEAQGLIAAARAEGAGWGQLLFETGASPLDPRVRGIYYTYGDLPLTALTLTAYATGLQDYPEIILLARVLAALVHATAIVALCLGGLMLGLPRAGVLCAGLVFAAAPTGFQIAGFGAVDIWLVAASAWATVGLLALLRPGGPSPVVAALTGVAIGAAVASKVTGLALLVPAAAALGLAWRGGPAGATRAAAAMGIGFALSVRVLSPFSFAGAFGLAPALLGDLAELARISASDHFPPNWQWQLPPPWSDRWRDFALFGIGPVGALGAVAGLAWATGRGPRLVLALLALGPLAHFALAETHPLRYAAPALPPLALLAAAAVARAPAAIGSAAVILALVWGSGIARLHLSEHSRIAASRWILAQPGPLLIAAESPWDDSLPVRAPDFLSRDDITIETLGLETAPDTAQVARIVALAARADLIVSSSGRFSEVQPHQPDRFPVAAAWFAGLDSGAFCIVPVWQRRPGYPLPFVTLDDSGVQEPWTVYDHPPVTIYARTGCFDAEALRAALTAALPPGG